MKKMSTSMRTMRFRPDYLLYYALLYPLLFVWLAFSKALGKRYSDDLNSNRNIFVETSAHLHAVLPWVYYS